MRKKKKTFGKKLTKSNVAGRQRYEGNRCDKLREGINLILIRKDTIK